jgi:hypothetical protein
MRSLCLEPLTELRQGLPFADEVALRPSQLRGLVRRPAYSAPRTCRALTAQWQSTQARVAITSRRHGRVREHFGVQIERGSLAITVHLPRHRRGTRALEERGQAAAQGHLII